MFSMCFFVELLFLNKENIQIEVERLTAFLYLCKENICKFKEKFEYFASKGLFMMMDYLVVEVLEFVEDYEVSVT